MAEYLILIHGDEAAFGDMDQADLDQMMKGHTKFWEDNEAVIRGGNALEPSSTATSIRTDDSGKASVTDGPFAETKEALGGYYLIDVDDLDQAIAVAQQVPAPAGGVEVRPIRVLG